MTAIEAIRDEMESAGVTPIYLLEGAPDSKVAAISLTPYMGEPIPVDQTIVGDIQRIQAFVRGGSYEEAYDLSWKAYEVILEFIASQQVFED